MIRVSEIIIDDDFIEKWHPLYDNSDVGGDYAEYSLIVKKVANELSQGTISKSTFIEILDWKAPRVKGKVRLDDFEYYEAGIIKAYEAPAYQKLEILDDLYGIGVPVASTILHFMYPSTFPIMDIRVAEVLYYTGYLKAKSRSLRNYTPFRRVIYNIEKKSKYSLREIDRALFAYHKIELEPKIRSKE